MTTLNPTDLLHAPMPTRELRGLGWHASLLTLGGVKWDSMIPEPDAITLIHRAIELGVNTFDTAPVYGSGKSEDRLGKALEGQRDRFWINTKTSKRDYDGARRDIEESLERLRTDTIDLMFVHAIGSDEDYERVLDSAGVLKAIEEFKAAGHVKHVGVSGHWFKHNMAKVIRAFPFEAVLLPVGVFNEAYGYSYVKEVIPVARELGITVMGMKVMGAGRAKHVADIRPYLAYSINQDIDTAVIGCETIEQLEANAGYMKSQPAAPSDAEVEALFDEARAATQDWDRGEFNWVQHYVKP